MKLSPGKILLLPFRFGLQPEILIAQCSSAEDGELVYGKRFFGRASLTSPFKRVLAAPRFKTGRKSDFVVKFPTVALRVRQVQKQARRIQSLTRLLKAPVFGPHHHGKVHDLWFHRFPPPFPWLGH